MMRVAFVVQPDGLLDQCNPIELCTQVGVEDSAEKTFTSARQRGKSGYENSTAVFEIKSDGEASLLRWPRDTKKAIIPEQIIGHTVTTVEALAFAPMQLKRPECWENFTATPVSFSVFCMRNAQSMTVEQSGPGPQFIQLPETIQHIGNFAFWRCTRLENLKIPDKVAKLGAGVFSECTTLNYVRLPSGLQVLGVYPDTTVQVMPDVGVFYGCPILKQICLPASLMSIGAYAFNSSGLVRIKVESTSTQWNIPRVHPTAFEHVASLQWMEHCGKDGKPVWRIGLPVARDKIVRGDKKADIIARLPYLFFQSQPQTIDELAFFTQRLDLLGRMSIARLTCPAMLTPAMENAYIDFIVDHFDSLNQFWPDGEDPYYKAFGLISASSQLNASHMNRILRQAGQLHLPQDLITEMIDLRNQRFDTITGFEDLKLE